MFLALLMLEYRPNLPWKTHTPQESILNPIKQHLKEMSKKIIANILIIDGEKLEETLN